MNRRSLILSGLSLPLGVSLGSVDNIFKAKKLNKNIIFICLDYGFLRKDLFFGNKGDFDSPYFDIIKDSKENFTYFNGVNQPNLLNSSHKAHAAALSCVRYDQKAIFPLQSVDQYIAKQSMRETKFRSVSFTTGKRNRISWNSEAQAVPGVNKVTNLHNKLFAKLDVDYERREINKKISILSKVQYNLARRSKSESDRMLASGFKAKVDELKEDLLWIDKSYSVDIATDPKWGEGDQHKHFGEALSLCTQAFKHRVSRVASVNFDGSGRVELKGVNTGYHGLSHKPKNITHMKEKQIIDEFILHSILAHVKDLKKHDLLNETIVVVTGAMGNSAAHSNDNLPVFLFGGGLQHQGIVNCKDSSNKLKISLADVYQTVIKHAGLPSMELPFSKGLVTGLL